MIRQMAVLCCVLLTLSCMALAQDLAPLEVRLEGLEGVFSEELLSAVPANGLILEQTGLGNEARIQQVQTGQGFPANIAAVLQSGLFNSVILEQVGIGNVSEVKQSGENNLYRLVVAGSNNRTATTQEGNGNIVTQELRGDNLDFIVLQQGNNNELYQVENGGVARNYTVSQVGDGIKLTIVNGMLPAGGGAVVLGQTQ